MPQKGKALCREGAPKKGKILCVYSGCAHVGANFVQRRYVKDREFFYTVGTAKGQIFLYTVGV